MTLTEIRATHPDFFRSYADVEGVHNPRPLSEVVAGQYFVMGYQRWRGALREYRIYRATPIAVWEVPGDAVYSAEAALRAAHWHNYERCAA